MKQDVHIAGSGEATESWSIPGEAAQPDRGNIAHDIMNMMEQGILVWSGDGHCELHNTRIFQVLELRGGELSIGTKRTDFFDKSVARGEFSTQCQDDVFALIAAHRPYYFDRNLPSGRVVLTSGRPMRGSGYVVTFTDVTEARKAAHDLEAARHQAEQAELRSRDVLTHERARQTEAKLLSQLDEWLQSCKSLEELFLIVSRFMARLLTGSKGELYIYSNSRDALEGKCNWNTIDLHAAIAADSCWALRRGRSYEFQADGLCFMCEHVDAHHHGVPVEEYICVPIVAHGDTVGLLHIRFDHLGPQSARIADKGAFAIRCGEHISMAIANVKLRDELRDQSIRDPLTGLYNRRFFMDVIRREISICERTTTPAAGVASSWYDTPSAPCASLVMPVTRSTAVVLSDRKPALVAAAGATRLDDSVRPVGMFDAMLAVILAPVWLVVTAQEDVASVTLVGAEPAVAVVIVSDGAPTKAIWLMALTWKVTVCVAVWAWAAGRATTARTARVRANLVNID